MFAPQKASLSIRAKLRIIVAAVFFVAMAGVIASGQIAKGAQLHLLNVLHLKYSVAVDRELRAVRQKGAHSPSDFDEIRNQITNVLAQPRACLDSITIVDKITMSMIGTAHTIDLCVKDLVAGDAVLAKLDEFSLGKISAEEAMTAVEKANAIFLQNSDDFEEPVFTTVDFIVFAMKTLLTIMGLSIAIFVWRISVGISKPLRALSARTEALGNGDIDSPVPALDRGDEIGLVSRAIDASRQAAYRMQQLTLEREKQNAAMRLVFDNVSQGLLTVDKNKRIQSEYSAVLTSFFGPPKPGQTFGEYIGLVSEDAEMYFDYTWEGLEEDFLPREVLLDQLPKRVRKEDRTYGFEYTIITNPDDDTIAGMMIVVTDITEKLRAELAEAKMQDVVRLFESYCKDESGIGTFFKETSVLIEQVKAGSNNSKNLLKRDLHTIKGNSGMHGLSHFAAMVHTLENMLEDADELPPQSIQQLINEWDEFSALVDKWSKGKDDVMLVDFTDYEWILQAIAAKTPHEELSQRLESWKWEKTEASLERLGRYAQAVSRRLGKHTVDLVVDGRQVRLPREPWGSVWNVLNHVVRNAVDHGIEDNDNRSHIGKESRGRLTLETIETDDRVQISIQDDGGGIDWDKLRAKAKELGSRAETSEQLVELLFLDGLSTRDEITDISGRGVGMSAVAATVEELGGHIEVKTEPGEGTRFIFDFPKRAH